MSIFIWVVDAPATKKMEIQLFFEFLGFTAAVFFSWWLNLVKRVPLHVEGRGSASDHSAEALNFNSGGSAGRP